MAPLDSFLGKGEDRSLFSVGAEVDVEEAAVIDTETFAAPEGIVVLSILVEAQRVKVLLLFTA